MDAIPIDAIMDAIPINAIRDAIPVHAIGDAIPIDSIGVTADAILVEGVAGIHPLGKRWKGKKLL